MTVIQGVNIRLVLTRLRPGAAYGWQGNGDFGHTLDAVEWRDPVTQKPTEAEVLAEWAIIEAQATQAQTLRQTILANAQSAVGKTLDTLTAAERNALLALLLYKAGGVDAHAGTVNPLADWLR